MPARKAKPTKAEIIKQTLTESSANTTSLRSHKFFYPLIIIIGLALLVIFASRYFVVAWVDKQPITRVEYYKALDSKYGKSMLEQMIVERLILDEAKSKGISVSNDEVSTEVKKFEDQQGGAAQLAQVLQMQGLTRNDLNNLVKLQLLRQKLFGEGVNITDDAVNKYIEQNKAQLPETIDDNLKNNIKAQLKQQQVEQSFNEWVQNALKSSRVQKNS